MCNWIIYWYIFIIHVQHALCTIDINMNELEYLAARLNPFECRRLIAALHYTSYELPKNVAEAERRVDEEISCLRQLLHWNSFPAEGKGKTHEAMAHRLRQINRNDLADWLGKMTFKQLGKDLDRVIEQPFKELVPETTSTTYLETSKPPDMVNIEDDSWGDVNNILLAILLGLLGTLLTLICITVIYRIKEYCRMREYRFMKESEILTECQELNVNRSRKKKCSVQCNMQSGHILANSETDTDLD